MEVHQHSHTAPIAIGGKKWTHYLWEFLMLFLAVFCGFLAENLREHRIERQREKQYILSFIEDLKSDTAAITSNIDIKSQRKILNDSLIWYLDTQDPNQYSQRIYLIARQLTRTSNFYSANRTIRQLINSGGLRLIRDQSVSDSILSYDQAIERIELTQNRQNSEISEIRPMMGKLMNPKILETMIDGDLILPPSGNPPLRTINKEFILDFIYAVHQLKSSDALNTSRLKRLKEKATGIIQFLQKDYGLK